MNSGRRVRYWGHRSSAVRAAAGCGVLLWVLGGLPAKLSAQGDLAGRPAVMPTAREGGVGDAAAGPYTAGTFRSPVAHPIKTSGTFGELRQDHFHMGLDVRSARGVAGDPLYAADSGYVSRIKISAAGYGNAVYVDHPHTGLRTLYAHLHTLAPGLRRYVDSVHYAREAFEIDVRPAPGELAVGRGERLGTMGNTGSSFGAHLHFETRLMADDAAFNPLLYDFPVRDTRAPEIGGLTVYRRVDAARLPVPLVRLTELRRDGDGTYHVPDTVRVPAGEIGLGLKAVDRQGGTRNRNGVYRIESRCDGQLHWRTTYDTVAFEDTRYIQAHYDYAARQGDEGYYYRLHRLPADAQPRLYDVYPDDGFVALGFGDSRTLEVTASDPLGNASTLRLVVVADHEAPAPPPPPHTHVLHPGVPMDITVGDASLAVPGRAVYADAYLTLAADSGRVSGAYSTCYRLGDPREPLHAPAELRVPLDAVPVRLRAKAYLSDCGDAREHVLHGELTTGSRALRVAVDEWGDYALRVDTVPPRIVPLDRYTYRISDDVTATRALRYRVTQDGRWVLAELDAKNDRLVVRRDLLGAGRLRVEVWDAAGNVARR